MNPIIERIGEQPKIWWQKGNDLVQPIVERLNERGILLKQRGEDLLTDIQERQGKLFDRGQKALNVFEETVLERTTEIMEWAYGVTGERSDVLRKSYEFLTERLAEFNIVPDVETEEEVVEEEVVEAVVETTPEPELTVPFEEYDKLNVKKLAMRLAECDKETLVLAKAYEEANKGRKTVFEAIEKLLED